MSAGGYHRTAAYKRSQKKAKKELNTLMGLLSLPLLPILLPMKFLLEKKKTKIMLVMYM